MVVITIFAILASLAIPSLLFLRQNTIEAELDKLQIICHLLQRQAVNTGHKEYMTLNINDHSCFYCNHTEKLANGVFLGFIPGVSGPPANPKQNIISAVSFPNQKITFYPNGTISAGTLYLTNLQKNVLFALTVPVSQVSLMRKYKYQDGAWTYLK